MSDRYAGIGKVLKTVLTQAGMLAGVVAIDQVVRTFVNHKFKQWVGTKKKEDTKIEVKQTETPAATPTSLPEETKTNNETNNTAGSK